MYGGEVAYDLFQAENQAVNNYERQMQNRRLHVEETGTARPTKGSIFDGLVPRARGVFDG